MKTSKNRSPLKKCYKKKDRIYLKSPIPSCTEGVFQIKFPIVMLFFQITYQYSRSG